MSEAPGFPLDGSTRHGSPFTSVEVDTVTVRSGDGSLVKWEVVKPAANGVQCPECGSQARNNLGLMRGMLAGSGDYSDENGDWHSHDPNRQEQGWKCRSCDHIYRVRYYLPCPSCDYNNDRTVVFT